MTMNKKYYTDYVRHMLRFYIRNRKQPRFSNAVDACDWLACDRVFEKCDNVSQDILSAVFTSNDELASTVYQVAREFNTNQGTVWDLLKVVERQIAVERNIYNTAEAGQRLIERR